MYKKPNFRKAKVVGTVQIDGLQGEYPLFLLRDFTYSVRFPLGGEYVTVNEGSVDRMIRASPAFQGWGERIAAEGGTKPKPCVM